MRTTEHGLKITLSELRELLSKAENEVMCANGVGYLYFRNDEVEQPCAYQDCASRYYRALEAWEDELGRLAARKYMQSLTPEEAAKLSDWQRQNR